MDENGAEAPIGLGEETLQNATYASWGIAVAFFCALCVFVWVYATYGQSLLDYLETVEPEVVFDRGKACERALQYDEAVAAYRGALALGFARWSPDYDCRKRLRKLLVERGRLKDTTINREATLLENGSFEQGLAGWLERPVTAEGLELDSAEGVHGGVGLRVDLSQGAADALRNGFAVVPGKQYRLSGWLRTVEAQPGVIPGVEASLADGQHFFVSGKAFVGTRDWAQWSFDFTAPETVQAAAVVLRPAAAPGVCQGTAWLDDCLLEPGSDNLLRNPSFELGDDGRRHWLGTLVEGVKATADGTEPLEGRRALRLDLSGAVDTALWQSAPVVPGAECRLTGWIRAKNLGEGKARFEVRDAERGWRAFSKQAQWVTGTNEWAPQTLTFTVPDGMKRVLVSLRLNAAQAGPDVRASAWFDAVTLVQTPPDK